MSERCVLLFLFASLKGTKKNTFGGCRRSRLKRFASEVNSGGIACNLRKCKGSFADYNVVAIIMFNTIIALKTMKVMGIN